jgi:flagellar basal-body rod modification protein FlgD
MATGVTNTPATGSTASNISRAGIADNFNTFLLLLTTQLQNQNPLEPLDTNQFTQQLVQFAGVEQQIQTNDMLSALLSLSDSSKMTSAVNFIGKTVVSSGKSSQLEGGKAEWVVTVPEAAPKTYVTIRDSEGNEVYSAEVALGQGGNKFTWDGRSPDGRLMPDGFYSIAVTARNASNAQITATTDISGKVDGVDFSKGDPILTIGTMRVKLSEVSKING